IRESIFKRKSGRFKGRFCVRLIYFDKNLGRERTEEKLFELKRDAVDYRDKRIRELKRTGGRVADGDKMTFNDLADICSDVFYKPAVIVEGKKIEGVRSLASVESSIKLLRRYFGKLKIRE